MQGKRGINIVSSLNLLKKKAREDRENHEETAVAMFDGFKPEATKRGSFQAIIKHYFFMISSALHTFSLRKLTIWISLMPSMKRNRHHH